MGDVVDFHIRLKRLQLAQGRKASMPPFLALGRDAGSIAGMYEPRKEAEPEGSPSAKIVRFAKKGGPVGPPFEILP